MSDWVLYCWSLHNQDGKIVSAHPTLEIAVYAALSWIEAERYRLPQLRAVYTIAELRYEDLV